jgi:cytochrome c556
VVRSRLSAFSFTIAASGVILICAGASFFAIAQDESATQAKEVILARKIVMNCIMDRMDKITGMISSRQINREEAREQAGQISAMLMAFPHLFPPASNQWKENAELDPVADTIASPEIWENYPDFYRQASAAWRTADELSRANDDDEIKRLYRALGIACDTCHALYLKE